MPYWVNEDRPTNRAIIHRDDCPHGAPQYKKPEDGKWHGPYATLREAKRVAYGTGRSIVRGCETCDI